VITLLPLSLTFNLQTVELLFPAFLQYDSWCFCNRIIEFHNRAYVQHNSLPKTTSPHFELSHKHIRYVHDIGPTWYTILHYIFQ